MKAEVIEGKLHVDKELLEGILFDDGIIDDMEVVDYGDWIDDGKYSYRYMVVCYQGAYYRVDVSRTGSYYSGLCYSSEYHRWGEAFPEVEKAEKIITIWRTVT